VQFFQYTFRVCCEILSVVGVNTRGGGQAVGPVLGQIQGLEAPRLCGPGDHHSNDPRLARSLNHLASVLIKAVVGEVAADVDQW
jgi:hypothetical protein